MTAEVRHIRVRDRLFEYRWLERAHGGRHRQRALVTETMRYTNDWQFAMKRSKMAYAVLQQAIIDRVAFQYRRLMLCSPVL